MKKYRPSNGSEGEWFQSKFCDRCLLDKEYRDTQENGCRIIAFTMCLDVKDPDYPNEWTYDKDGHPTCIAYIPDTPEEQAKKEWRERRDKNTIDMFEERKETI